MTAAPAIVVLMERDGFAGSTERSEAERGIAPIAPAVLSRQSKYDNRTRSRRPFVR